jgi:phosphate transport system substrate-binding protein
MCGTIALQAQKRVVLVGSGSSNAVASIGAWAKDFNNQRPSVQVAYVMTSSRDGIEQVSTLHGDFAVGELPLTDKQKNNKNVRLAQIPIAVFTVVPVYNLPGTNEVRFTGELLAQLYMGHITNWNDKRIAKLNPGVKFPDLGITLVQRPVGTGTRYLFSEFLAKASIDFRNWTNNGRHGGPPEIVEELNQRMAARVASTPGALGFVTWNSAVQSGLTYGAVQNSSGRFVKAAPESISAAAAAMEKLVFDPLGPLLDAPGRESYPLTGFVWIYVPIIGNTSQQRADNLYDFLDWCLGNGQVSIEGHGYDPLPKAAAAKAQAELHKLLR